MARVWPNSSIPDFINESQIGEIKDTKIVTNTKQLRIQREAAKAQDKEHVVITGDKTKVSQPVHDKCTVVRRDDLGPPQ